MEIQLTAITSTYFTIVDNTIQLRIKLDVYCASDLGVT